jgi:hypothetical protein
MWGGIAHVYLERTQKVQSMNFFYAATFLHMGATPVAEGLPFHISICNSWASNTVMPSPLLSGHHWKRPFDSLF